MEHIIGFPGLFESRYVIDRVAFDLGKLFGGEKSIPIYWYGIIIVSAMILAYIYFMIRAKRSEGIVEDDTTNIMLFALPIGIIGARAFYVLTNLSHFNSFKEAVFGIRDGGLAIYGGIVFGLITILVYCFIKKISTFKTLDAIAPAVMMAQAIGRWGNFFNAEAYGKTEGVENFFLRMSIANIEAPNAIKYVHPTFLYESVWNILGFIIANLIYRKKKFDGQIFCFYIFWYGLGRGFIELLRADSCMILEKFIKSDPLDVFDNASGEGLKAFVYLSIALVITSIALYIFLNKKKQQDQNEISELKAIFEEDEEEGYYVSSVVTPSNETASDEVTNNETTSGEVTNNETASDEVANDETTSNEVANDETTSDEVANNDVTNDEVASDEVANDETERDQSLNVASENNK